MAALRPQTRARHLQLKIQKLRQQLAEAEAALAALPPLGVEAPPPAPLIPAETFAKAFLASPILMALSELETGRYVDVNEAFLRTLGFEREAVVGRTAQELGLFAQPEQRQAALEQLQAEGRLRNFEVAVRARSGELRTGRFAAEFVHVGERRLLLTVMEDITDQRRTEAALLASEARFRSYVEFAPHAIFVVDRQGRYVDFNPAALDLLGYPPAELARLSIADVVAEVDLERGLQSFGVVMSAGRAEGEFRLRHRAGHVVWVALRAVRLNDERFIAFCQDVTAQHAAEQAAHTSEARYRTTLDAMLEGCQIIGFDWRYLYLNEAAVRQARQTGAALLGRTMPEAYPGIETTELFAVLQRCMADRQPRRIDNEFTYPDGQVGRFELSIQPVAEGLFILSQDVSARRQAEAALRRSEERFRLLAENMADVIWILDTATLHFSYVSPSVERLRGYTVAEVLAQTIDQVMTPASLAMIQAELPGRLAAFLAGDPAVVTQTHEVEQIRRDGSLVWTEVVTTLLRQPGGGVEILGVSRDISERRRAADALRESETRYRALFEGAAIGIFHSTFEGQYLDLNPALARMLGYATPAEVLADIHDVARQTYTDPARRETIIAQLLDQGGTLVVENRYHRRGGPDWDAYLHLRCVTDPAGRPLYLEGFVEDITERKRAETALRESERKLQTLIELLPIGISILNAERRVVYANPALCRILDMDREQFFQGAYGGRRYLNVDRTPMPADGFASLRALREGRPVLDVETGVVTEAGREMWASVSAVPVDFADWRVVIATADITARKQAETALRESEARYRGLVDSAPDAIFVNRADRVAFVNAACLRLFGAERPEQLLGRPPFELIHPDDHAAVRERIRQMRATGQAVPPREQRMLRLDGSAVAVEASAAPFRDQGVDAIHVTLRDITERQRAEMERAKLTQRLDLATRSAHMGIWDWDIQQNVLTWDDQMYSLYGLKPGEFGGAYAAWLQGVHPEDRDLSNTHSARAVRGEQEYDSEFRVQWPDGTVRWLKAAGQVFRDEQGAPVRMVGVNYDITERKRAEDELRRSNAELEQFAYVASHDLQEPLRGVAGMVQLLQHNYQGRLDAGADELIGHAVEAAGRMQTLINDLLAYSRAGRRGGAFQRLEAHTALQAALDNLAVTAAETEAVITPGPLPAVVADPTQLTQVFQNLLSNALKFRGGRRPVITVTAERQAGAWRFAVQDNGLGIEPQYFERIFLIFQRLHTRREYPGTGIGLALCQRIIERHGGRLWVESQPGQGSTFYFTLPDREPSDDR